MPLAAHAVQIDFGGVALTTPPATAYAGPGGGVFYNGSDSAGGFSAGSAFFANQFTNWGGGFTSWAGWAYSTTSDAVTPGVGNQYSAYLPSPASRPYALAYNDGARITLPPEASTPLTATVALTTYTALSILNGDSFNDPFGPGDWFFAEFIGRDGSNAETGRSRIYLADYRSEAPAVRGVLSGWITMDLASLGSGLSALEIVFGSSDTGKFGINTPTYLALDSLTFVPEPSTWALCASAAALTLALRRRRS
jgi:hypothetical protein